ncbi:MAG: nucleotidyltransferase family protein [Bacteroidaceae bacterium]|nr:nucleotidyltransferase family protein [Bacteroidaceae bacterium]
MMTPERDLMLQMVKMGTGKADKIQLVRPIRWGILVELLFAQGTIGFAYDGLQRIYEVENTLDKKTREILATLNNLARDTKIKKLQWFGKAMDGPKDYAAAEKALSELAAFYAQHGIDMMLLKGYGLNQYYPKPTSRTLGDFDIYLFGKWMKGDEAVSKELGIAVQNDCEHHTVFMFEGYNVENHYDFVNVKVRRSSSKIDKEMKELAKDKCRSMEVNGQRIYLPCPNLNALFLLRHTAGHFAADGVSIRHMLDWAFFVEKEGLNVDWAWLVERARHYNMHQFLSCMNQICVEDLGFNPRIFPVLEQKNKLKARVLEEIFAYEGELEKTSLKMKTERWWEHRWKHRICYSDSLLSSFLTSAMANLIKR